MTKSASSFPADDEQQTTASEDVANVATADIKSVGILCSGGDSPGMNAAVRSAVRTALGAGLDVYGIRHGYSGLLEGDIFKMNASSVGNIIQRGGTILQTSRCPEFHEEDIRREAAHILKRKEVNSLVVIGGNGSFNGAWRLNQEHGIPVVGIPGTIDNDISGTEYTIGFQTAIQTAVEAVDKIRDTAASHERTFIVEVMGRQSPAIAYQVGVATGAEMVVEPNKKLDITTLAGKINYGIKRGKTSSLIIVAEGKEPGLSYKISQQLDKEHGLQCRICVLGHIQRGGSPCSSDRYMASAMGYEAIQAILSGHYPVVTGFNHGKIELVPFKNCLEKQNDADPICESLIKALSI